MGHDIEWGLKKSMDTHEIQHFEARGINNNKSYDFSVYPSLDGISAYWREITNKKNGKK